MNVQMDLVLFNLYKVLHFVKNEVSGKHQVHNLRVKARATTRTRVRLELTLGLKQKLTLQLELQPKPASELES